MKQTSLPVLEKNWHFTMNKQLLTKINLPDTAVVVDVGAGDGKRNKHLWKHNYQGVDLNVETDNVFKGDATVYLQGFAPNYADLLISEYSIQFMKKPQYVAALMRKALKVGGYLYLTTFEEELTTQDVLNMAMGMELIYFSKEKVLDPPHKGMPEEHEHTVMEVLARKV